MQIRSLTGLSLPLVALAAAPSLLAGQSADSAAFIVRLGQDTTAVERYVRMADRIEAVSVSRSPRTSVQRLTIWLTDDGSVARYATGGATGDMNERPSPDGSIPIVGGFYVPWELALARAARSGDAAATIGITTGFSAMQIEMRRTEAGTWRFGDQFDQPVEARIDGEGHMQRYAVDDGRISAERVEWVDIDAIREAFLARDRSGAAMGPLSPLDSVRASTAGASLVVEYSRPSLRGRALDMLVPPGEVWRMGANNATTLETDRALRFGEFELQPGTYSMFISREDGRWSLIFNSETGMSGLARDPARDVGRVPLDVSRLDRSVEQFTILIETNVDGGAIHARWGTVGAAASFSVR
jgi:hypothetical protein